MNIQHIMEACDKSSGACSYNGKKKGNDANTNDPSSNEGCCKKEACPTTNEVCKNEGCKKESSIFDGAFQALDEFKGDTEMQALERNLHDKLSGDHDYAKTYRANKNKFRDDISGRDINKGKVRTAKDEKRYREEKNAACKAADRISRNSSRPDMASAVRKSCGESASIFNTLLDQV